MPKYAFLFSLKQETIAGMMQRPGDRAAAVRETAEAAGGSIEAYYWMFGQYDGMIIADLPDSKSAAAVSVAVVSSGALADLETHELFDAKEVTGILEQAKDVTYGPPGA